ncbi:hypothetical protein [Gelidibacter mesophilus]|uniref:hypothetical protein n=1 Tax=Gelidibacter mesophilus TaxID=169050 RepID=UPI00040986AF|nr:hypothetical protein [Gelidibacter mesophilus]
MRNILHKVIDWIFNKSLYVSGIAVIFLSIIDISNINDWTITAFGIQEFEIGKVIYGITVLTALVFGIISITQAKDVAELEKDKKEKGLKITDLETTLTEIIHETSDLFNSYIKLIVKNLGFTHQERISVYKVYEDGFTLIGRSSINPNLMEKGRPKYPLSDGFIGKGWAEGEFFINNLPDPNSGNGNRYYQAVNKINFIEKDVVDNMNMKSRTYFVYRINGFDSSPKAILVFESERENAFTKQEIIDSLAGIKQPLVMFIEKNYGVKILDNIDLDNDNLEL